MLHRSTGSKPTDTDIVAGAATDARASGNSATDSGATGSDTSADVKEISGSGATMHSADREFLAEQVIGQTPLLPPREPLGARIAALLGRRHGILLALCTLGLWVAMTLRPPGEGETLRRGATATHDVIAPRAATLLDRRMTAARKRDAASLVPPVYDGSPTAQAQAMAELTAISAAQRSIAELAPTADIPSTNNAPRASSPAKQAKPAAHAVIPATSPYSASSSSPDAAGARAATRGLARGAGSSSLSSLSSLSSTARPRAALSRGAGVTPRGRPTQSTAEQQSEVAQQDEQVRQQAQAQRRGALLSERLGGLLPSALAARVMSVAAGRWTATQSAAEEAVRAAYLMGDEVQPVRSDHLADDLAAARRRMADAVRQAQAASKLSATEAALALALARRAVRGPNFVANARKTERARQEARNRVSAVYRNILPGTVLVEAGAVIDDEKWAQLRDMELVAPRFDRTLALARLLLCGVLVAFCAGALARLSPDLLAQPAALWLAAAVPVAFIAVFRSLLRVPQGDQAMVPLVATGAMLLTILLNARVGLLAAFLMTSLCAVMARADNGLFLATLLSASVGALGVSELASRVALLRAGVLLALTNVALAVALGLLREAPGDEIARLALWGAACAPLAVGVTACLVMFLERPFGITTHLRLLELSAPDELVMRRMQAEAPGTYTHSLMVSQLAEAAAKEVGADPLLCRVGGLYHDIGKLRRPHCFIENQSGDNIHDRLSPQMSALLLVAHVKDGLELGRALRLPQPVLDIIAQHHGTTLIAYFYHRALRQAAEAQQARSPATETASVAVPTKSAPPGHDERRQSFGRRAADLALTDIGVAEDAMDDSATAASAGAPPDTAARDASDAPDMNEALFRYPGPRPQSKEAAIVLLADTIEASSRALPDLTPERLEAHIKTMLAQRLQDGELAECELTLRDLGTIQRRFAHVLRGALHQRIEYPDAAGAPAREWKKMARGGHGQSRSERGWRPGRRGTRDEDGRATTPAAATVSNDKNGANENADVEHDSHHESRRETERRAAPGDRRRAESSDAGSRDSGSSVVESRRQSRRHAREHATQMKNARNVTLESLSAHLNRHEKPSSQNPPQRATVAAHSTPAVETNGAIGDNSVESGADAEDRTTRSADSSTARAPFAAEREHSLDTGGAPPDASASGGANDIHENNGAGNSGHTISADHRRNGHERNGHKLDPRGPSDASANETALHGAERNGAKSNGATRGARVPAPGAATESGSAPPAAP